MIQYNSSKRER